MFTLSRKLINYIIPPNCIFCRKQIQGNKTINLCNPCSKQLPWVTSACKNCGLPLENETSSLICAGCIQGTPLFNHAIIPFHYQAPINNLILNMKFQQQLLPAHLLGQLAAKQLEQYYQQHSLPQALIPIPLHKTRLRQRGYNQALELSRPMAKALNIPMDRRSIIRCKASLAQASIPARKRYSNIRHAFSVRKKINYQHVIVIDDVITTGHTIREFCSLLRKMGVEKIDLCCIASTFGHKKNIFLRNKLC